MEIPPILNDRYEVEKRIGQGGMGWVYRALDRRTGKRVAIKVMKEEAGQRGLDLFNQEWKVLAELQHPFIVDLTDCGEFSDGATVRPFFVMPFLRGRTLQDLIREQSTLPLEQVLEITCAACSALHAAHSRNIIHRDVKPSNIFILETGGIKVIDFGVAHLSGLKDFTTFKGTRPYTAPELLDPKDPKPPSPHSDVFSLAVVCYESLTGTQPFDRHDHQRTTWAILNETPQPAVECRSDIPLTLSQVIQKGMAKRTSAQQYTEVRSGRYSSAKEFGEKLQKAVRGEVLPEFDKARIEARLAAIQQAFDAGDIEQAHGMLRDAEQEGQSHPSMSILRSRIDQARHHTHIQELLSRTRWERDAKQYQVALEILDEVFERDTDNPEAPDLKASVISLWAQERIEEAKAHLRQRNYSAAREALRAVMELHRGDPQALELETEVDHEEAYERQIREQKESIYKQARDAYANGETGTALNRLMKLMALIDESGGRTESDSIYVSFHGQLRLDHDELMKSHTECMESISGGNLGRAHTICEQVLAKHRDNALFRGLKLEVEIRERQLKVADIADLFSRAEAVPDLDARIALIQESINRLGVEPFVKELLRNTRDKRDLISSLLAQAKRIEEDRHEFGDALEKLQIVKQLHSRCPNLEADLERVQRRCREQEKSEKKHQAVDRIEISLQLGQYDQALELIRHALAAFPGDRELLDQQMRARDAAARGVEAERFFEKGKQLLTEGHLDDGLKSLRQAHELDSRQRRITEALGSAILEKARTLLKVETPTDPDWAVAEQLAKEASDLLPGDPVVRSMNVLIADRKQREFVAERLSVGRALAFEKDLRGALKVIEEALSACPNESRLLREQDKLRKQIGLEPASRSTSSPEQLGRVQPEAKAAAAAAGQSPAINAQEGESGLFSMDDEPDDEDVEVSSLIKEETNGKRFGSRLRQMASRAGTVVRGAPARLNSRFVKLMNTRKGAETEAPYEMIAVGPNGHRIGSNDNGQTWYDIQTGKALE